MPLGTVPQQSKPRRGPCLGGVSACAPRHRRHEWSHGRRAGGTMAPMTSTPMTSTTAPLIGRLPDTAAGARPDPDALYEAFSGWAADQGLALYPHQDEALI